MVKPASPAIQHLGEYPNANREIRELGRAKWSQKKAILAKYRIDDGKDWIGFSSQFDKTMEFSGKDGSHLEALYKGETLIGYQVKTGQITYTTEVDAKCQIVTVMQDASEEWSATTAVTPAYCENIDSMTDLYQQYEKAAATQPKRTGKPRSDACTIGGGTLESPTATCLCPDKHPINEWFEFCKPTLADRLRVKIGDLASQSNNRDPFSRSELERQQTTCARLKKNAVLTPASDTTRGVN